MTVYFWCNRQFENPMKRNTHADYNSPLPADAQPVLANGVTLDAPVSLYWSDEFTAGGTGKQLAMKKSTIGYTIGIFSGYPTMANIHKQLL